MILKDFIAKYQIILILSFIVVSMAMVRMIWGYRGEPIQNQTPKTTITSLPSPTESALNEKDYPLWKLLPYKSENFTVEQYQKPLTLTVLITKEKQAAAKKELNSWLESLEVDVSSQEIEWVILP